ncbi:MAG: TadE/TadG family type IV pilus assembly protein [Alphaproteobacteria bacterium]
MSPERSKLSNSTHAGSGKMPGIWTRLMRRLRRDERGTSVVEFALFSPVLAFSALLMVDVGTLISERMETDRLLRVGAESAMIKQDEATIASVMQSSMSEGFSIAITANRYCSCPETSAAASCSTPCSSTLPPNVFVDLTATRPFKGIFLPEMTLSSDIRVQLR